MPDETKSSLIDYRPDGRVRLSLLDKTTTLRRPTMGEVHRFQDALADGIDEWLILERKHGENLSEAAAELGVDLDADPLAEAAGKLLGYWQTVSADMADADTRTETLAGWVGEVVDAQPKDDEPPPPEWATMQRKMRREHQRTVAGLWIALGRDVVSTLAKPTEQLPDSDDELDPAIASQSLYVALLRHWTHVPLPSGV